MSLRLLLNRFVPAACLVCGAIVSDADGSSGMGDALERAVETHSIPGARVGVAVRRLSDGQDVSARDADQSFEIASNTKLFTTAAALWKLGADYQFMTAVVANGTIGEGKLAGDLLIVGSGDPAISGRFHGGDKLFVPRAMAQAVRKFGIKEITGDLVMDDRFFDRLLRPPGWPAAESLWWYAAPVSALSYNDNCVDIRVKGAKASGMAAVVGVSPEVGYAKVINRTKTCGKKERGRLRFARNRNGAIIVSGRIRVGRTRRENITVTSPPLYLAAAIRKELAHAGVAVKGRSRLVHDGEKTAHQARTIYAWETPLAQAVNVANRRSQNFFAEQILKTIGAEQKKAGTTANGIAEVKDFAGLAGLPRGSVSPTDGCGLSPGNGATPAAIVGLLAFMYRGKHREVYYNSLAVNGDPDTTMRRRLTEDSARGRIHAKTGTIKSRGVSALSGYAEALDGETYAFSILVNGCKRAHLYRAKRLENALCRVILGVQENHGKSGERRGK